MGDGETAIASESDPSAGSSSTHRGFSNLSHIKKALRSACTHCSISPHSTRVNRCSCSTPTESTDAYVTELCRDDHFLEGKLLCQFALVAAEAVQSHAVGKGGVEQGCDFCAHEVDLHQSFAVFTGPWPDIVKVTWQTELFNACSTECAFRQRSRFIGVVHDKGDGCKCEATSQMHICSAVPVQGHYCHPFRD